MKDIFFIFRKKVYISENFIHSIDSLKRVKYLPNGRIYFLSVDELTRCAVNTMSVNFSKLNTDKLKLI